jgi:putative DNA primase/helicase
MIVELRGELAQTVFPGSTHESGERIAWESDGEPAAVEPWELIRSVALLAAASLYVRYAPSEGSRHNAALALGGALLKAGLDYDEAEHFMTVVLGDGRCDDINAELKGLRGTEKRLQAGRPVAGFAKLAEFMDSSVVKKLQEWLELAGEQHPPGWSPTTLPFTDDGNAQRLARDYGGVLRFVPAWDRWLCWNGAVWERDARMVVNRYASAVAHSIATEAGGEANHQLVETCKKWHVASQSRARLEAMIALARPRLVVAPDDLDQHPTLLNVANGTLDLERFELLPHDRTQFFTRIAPVVYEPHAACPLWMAFLRRVMGDREELVQYLQRIVGYMLTGETREQCFFVFYGEGANGKSTFLDVLQTLLGDYARPTEARTLLTRVNSDGVRNDLAALFGLRVATASEVPRGAKFDESMVKQLTGGDKITARFLFKEYFDFIPQFKLVLAVNHKPGIQGVDEGIWRRIRLIPFDVVIPPEERDHHLNTKLRAELPGIFAWAVEGCRSWRQHGLGDPQAVIDATAAYRAESDDFREFFASCCQFSPTGKGQVAVGELYRVYAVWADLSGGEVLKKDAFTKAMSERHLKSEVMRLNGLPQRVYRGLAIRDEWQRGQDSPPAHASGNAQSAGLVNRRRGSEDSP